MTPDPWQSEFKRFWNELVPPYGQAKTVQGEMIRAIGRLSEEAYRNGNANFDHDHVIMCQFLLENLNDPRVFSAKEIEDMRRWIGQILDSKQTHPKGPDTCFSHIAEQVVRWCDATKKLIPHELNSELNR